MIALKFWPKKLQYLHRRANERDRDSNPTVEYVLVGKTRPYRLSRAQRKKRLFFRSREINNLEANRERVCLESKKRADINGRAKWKQEEKGVEKG